MCSNLALRQRSKWKRRTRADTDSDADSDSDSKTPRYYDTEMVVTIDGCVFDAEGHGNFLRCPGSWYEMELCMMQTGVRALIYWLDGLRHSLSG